MKTISYQMFIKHKGQPIAEAWTENISESVPDNLNEKEHARNIVAQFNRYLKPGEQERILVDVEPIETTEVPKLKHDWNKTSLVTERGGFDKMQCNLCRITGKRYGLGYSGINIDRKFSKYIHCPGKAVN